MTEAGAQSQFLRIPTPRGPDSGSDRPYHRVIPLVSKTARRLGRVLKADN